MSAIGGLHSPGVPAPDAGMLSSLARALGRRGPDGVSVATVPEVGMIHVALHTAPGPHPEQPCRRGSLLVTWDGRLDNRADLAVSLGAEGVDDLELLAIAYERWGPAFPSRLVGDFALAVWDGRSRLLVLARDPVGTRSLFYVIQKDGALLWSSTLGGLHAIAAISTEIDEEWVAGYFSWSIDPATTPWRGVRAVPPGHVLIAGGQPPRLECFWRIEDVPEVRLGGDAEYEERYRELFLAAVRNRLRATGPVTAELSGGVDSSSIACAAAYLLRADGAEAPGLLTVSHVYERSRTADESPFIQEVESWIGRSGRHILESETPILTGLTGDVPDVPHSNHCFRERYLAVYGFMGENGSRVLLSGLGGDHLLTSQVDTPYVLADLLRAGRLGALRAALAAWRRELGKPYLQLLWDGALCPLLPRPARLRLARPPIPFPSWLDPRFVRRRDLAARFVAFTDAAGHDGPPSKREQTGAVLGALRSASWLYDWWGRPVEVTFPYLDRPLMEFCLGTPAVQFVRPGETRSLHRRALAGLLPPRILTRRDKRGPEEAVLRAFPERWGEIQELLDEPRIVQHGWVEPAAFRQALQAARFGKPGENLLLVLSALALEAWMRSHETPSPSVGG